jgi:hypothetical protein
MIGHENVLLRLVVWHFVNIPVINADQEKPNVGPVTAKAEYEIASFDLAKKQGKENDGYNNDHQRHKYDKGIQTIEYPDRRKQEFHVTK